MAERRRRRKPAELARDRRRIANLYLQGWLQADIGKELGLSQKTISRDLKALHRVWREAALVDFNEAKARELAKGDNLECIYHEAWKRSCEDKESTLTEKIDATASSRSKAQIRKEGRVGDPRFLAGAQWCIERRCKLLGLDAPQRQEITGADGGDLSIVIRDKIEAGLDKIYGEEKE